MAAAQLSRSAAFIEVRLKPRMLVHLPPGAIVVWGRTQLSPHGHISVALGNGVEASDHIQRQLQKLRGALNFRVFVPREDPRSRLRW